MTGQPQELLQPAIPAATLVLFRERAEAAPDILMVERSSKMVFAGGAIVFPGGRVDADDHLLAARSTGIELDCAAARVAAIRETIEESGIPIAIAGRVHEGWLNEARAALHNRATFSSLLDEAGLTLDLSALQPFSRWRPNFKEARIFDTRFYIARAPDNLPEAIVDATENVRTMWMSAQGAIEAGARGDVHIIFPTHRNLDRLAQFGSFDEALAHARSTPTDTITPWIEERDGTPHLCIPEGLGYPITSEPISSAKRAGD